MEDLLPLLLLLLGALLIVAFVLLVSRGSQVVVVNDDVVIAASQAEVERQSFGMLGSIPGATMTQSMPGQVVVTAKWTPSWVIVVAILSFPLGLLLLLLVRQDLVLNVRFAETSGGTLVQVTGKSRRKVAIAVGAAFDRLSGSASLA